MSWVTTRISKMDHINAAQKKHQSVSKEIWLALFRREVLSWVTTRISKMKHEKKQVEACDRYVVIVGRETAKDHGLGS